MVDKLNVDKLNKVPSNLNNLKSTVDKLDTRKLETTEVNLSNLRGLVNNDVAKTTEYDE